MRNEDWANYNHETVVALAKDIYTPPGIGTGKRTVDLIESGIFRLARRDASLYSVQIKTCGSWGKLLVWDCELNLLFYMPSTFTGSFVLEGCGRGGLIAQNYAGPGPDSLVTINYTEKDLAIV